MYLRLFPTGRGETRGKTLAQLKGNVLKSVLAAVILILSVSCGGLSPQRQGEGHTPGWINKYDRPLTVVILPFENLTPEQGLESLVREGFSNHFSSMNFRDIEPSEVDRILRNYIGNHAGTWRDLPPARLGELFHADFMVLGKVIEYKKLFAGLYSQIALGVELEMVECRTGEGVWSMTLIKRSHDGGIPFDLFGIIPAALRSGLHMKKERTLDLIERISRDFVSQIPNPPLPALSPHSVDIQVASFLDETLAGKTLRQLEEMGLNPRIETVTLNGRIWHRLFLGPYINLSEAEVVKNRLEKDIGLNPIFIHRFPEDAPKAPEVKTPSE